LSWSKQEVLHLTGLPILKGFPKWAFAESNRLTQNSFIMKQFIFFILFILCALQIQAQCGNPKAEVCLSFTANQTANDPLVPTNLPDVFKGEIAAKISVEVGVAFAAGATGAVAGAPSGFLGSVLVGGGLIGATGAANTNSWGANYGINTWAPYFKYGVTPENKSISQTLAVNVDVFKVPNNQEDRFIVIGAKSVFNGNDEFSDGRDMLRSKYVDKYTFAIKPLRQDKNNPKCILMSSIPLAVNRESAYTNSFSWSVGGGLSVDPSGPGGSTGANISYTVSSTTGYKDFELRNSPQGQMAGWLYQMKNTYADGVPQLYDTNNPNGIVFNGALTKWLRKPADLALGQNSLDMISLYKIGVNDDEPVEFEFESVMRVMHAEVIGRWGAAPYLSGIAMAIPSFCLLKGTITVDPDPSDPSKTTITKKITESTYYTLSDFMDMQNTPLPTLTPPIIPGGCYAIKNVHRNKYITHGGGPGVINYYADREATQQHEKITLVYRGKKPNESKDLYAMYSQDGRFISANAVGGAVYKSEQCNDSELWEIESAGNNQYYIRSYVYNRWLSANNNWFGQLGTSENKGEWEVWKFDQQSGGCVTSPLTSLPSASYNSANASSAPTPIPLEDENFSFMVGESGSTGTTEFSLTAEQQTMLDQRAQLSNSQTNIYTPGNITQNLQAMTIEAWVKNDGGPENIQAIVSSANLDFAHLQASDDSNVKCAVYVNNGEVYLPAVPKNPGNWQHVAIVIQSGNSQLYINGSPYGAKDTKTFTSIKPAGNVLIGKGYSNGRSFNGKIANVRIWNRALPKGELSNLLGSFNLNDGPGLLYHSPTTNALTIASVNDCVSIPASTTTGVQSLTIEAWVNNDSPQTDIQAIVSATGPEFVHLQLSADGQVNNAVYLDDGRSFMLPVVPKIAAGWHHVAMVIESGNSRIYLDGQQIGAADTTTFSGIKPSSSVFIGKGWSGGRVFSGRIADVRIWKNRPLTQAQLSAYQFTPPPSDAVGLVYHYK
jgi:hypothetical protein